MNQILNTKKDFKKRIFKKKWFNIQLYFSIFIIVILVVFLFIYINNLSRNENKSNSLINNYNIYKLYANDYSNSNESSSPSNVFGTIEIPRIGLYYPIFSYLNDDLLKISPCKVSRQIS